MSEMVMKSDNDSQIMARQGKIKKINFKGKKGVNRGRGFKSASPE